MAFRIPFRRVPGQTSHVLRSTALLATLLTIGAAPAAAPADTATLEALRAADLRLGAIGYRLATANAALCSDVAPVPGIVVHAIDQYAESEQPAARTAFGFATGVAVEGVVPDSPAARAGLHADDTIVSVNGQPVPVADGAGHVRTRDAMVALIDAQPVDRPLTMVVRRAGSDRSVAIAPSLGCRTLFELRVGTTMDAVADGRLVQISSAFLDKLADPQLAVVVAHELSHNILRHHARLDAARVSRGLLRELGRNGRLHRATEDDADRLGVHLLRNAGWDPQEAVRFWRGPGARIDGGIFHSRTHSSASKRAQLIAAELAALPKGAPIPYRPPVLSTRDQPLQ
ncbi:MULTISPECIES: M48 family metallopeptidase [Sphingomonas]|uniref:M48 family metallopeptidase n=1 Tax=Sphingomonas TaxID=13687 RepID=UPI000A04998A|nr:MULTISPECIES: M48 family metallopeptidase [Sphingomonas]PZT93531.1 MAG: PDZ domain-containing protein [Sphingomonas sp.]RSV32064.1 PDZ domain-containing protein [Sphingomonas sp. ABOLH]